MKSNNHDTHEYSKLFNTIIIVYYYYSVVVEFMVAISLITSARIGSLPHDKNIYESHQIPEVMQQKSFNRSHQLGDIPVEKPFKNMALKLTTEQIGG